MTTLLHNRHFMPANKWLFIFLFALSLNNLSAQTVTIVTFGTHQYEYVPAEDISWTDAKAAALARSNGCTQGYLVTITSQGENDFVTALSNGRFAWMGATDAGHPNTWNWESGGTSPENGKTFYIRTSTGGSNVTFSTFEGTFNYSNWDFQQPDANAFPYTEQYGQFYPATNGKWNDLPNTGNSVTHTDHPHIGGYVVEYNPCSSGGPTLGCTVCHSGHTLNISCNALKAHLAHGDQIGPCSSSARIEYTSNGNINHLDNISMADTRKGSISGNFGISIYPNPVTNGNFTLSLNGIADARAEINITDINGRVIEKRILNTNLKQQTTSFNLSKNAKGLYFVKVITASGVQTSRVIVQ